MAKRRYALADSSIDDPTDSVRYLLPLMQRNIATDGFVFTDPTDSTKFSLPGCIIASPSFDRDLSSVTQNYVYNWTRDAAIAAIEIALADWPTAPGAGSGPLDDYVSFADTCQSNAPTLARACYTIEGQPRDWTDQNDGPALQTLAILAAYSQLDASSLETARGLVSNNLAFLLANYREPSFNLWEETRGQSFFTRSVQLRCLTEVASNALGIDVPAGVPEAIGWLGDALAGHWNGDHYASILDAENPRDGYDPNIDIVMACVYGAVDCVDPRLLATAAQLRWQWSDPASPRFYAINGSDQARGLCPLLGRYPGDVYDGDNNDSGTSHPWVLTTANFAELYYRVAAIVARDNAIPTDPGAVGFLEQVAVDGATSASDAVQRLRDAGDTMLRAIVFHSDHLELSEQFDGTTGYEKSVRNLTWSYAAFLSAVRARSAIASPV